MSIEQKIAARVAAVESLLCVGLDSRIESLPARFQSEPHPQFAFNRWIIEQTHPYTLAYKPNMAFYEARGESGWHDLRLTLAYLRENHPDILTISDAKRGDMATSSECYMQAVFDTLGFDCVTLNPYQGQEGLQPFLERDDKACIILCRTSNVGAREFQDLLIDGKPLWQVVAERVRDHWNTRGNCMLVVGATVPEELARVRELVGEMTLLVPGVGTQGGDLKLAVQAGLNSAGRGLLLNVSRAVIFAENPAEASRQLRDEIRLARGQVTS